MEFVLGGAGEGEVGFDGPWGFAFVEIAAKFFGVFADAAAAVFFEVDDVV